MSKLDHDAFIRTFASNLGVSQEAFRPHTHNPSNAAILNSLEHSDLNGF